MSPSAGRRSALVGLAPRLVTAQALVLAGGAVTAWVVATAVAPGIFHDHLQRAGVHQTSPEARHVEEAFGSALIVALGVALLTSVIMGLAVTAYFIRRIQQSTAAVATSAVHLARGHYDTRVPSPGIGAEFDQLTATVNELAQRLGDVESTRRRILADLAHEMRTPLATIEAHLEAVEDGVRSLDAPTLAVLHGGTQRLRRLADDMGAVSKAEEGRIDVRPQPTAVHHVLDAAAFAAQDAYRDKGVALHAARSTAPAVLADPERLAQVLGNLLDNALRHTAPGQQVRLSATRTERNWVDITVTDTGEGISNEHLEHIFDRFYRADPSRSRGSGGTGIGLTISRAFVEAHGGQLTATSAGPGKGAAFTVRLPVAAIERR